MGIGHFTGLSTTRYLLPSTFAAAFVALGKYKTRRIAAPEYGA